MPLAGAILRLPISPVSYQHWLLKLTLAEWLEGGLTTLVDTYHPTLDNACCRECMLSHVEWCVLFHAGWCASYPRRSTSSHAGHSMLDDVCCPSLANVSLQEALKDCIGPASLEVVGAPALVTTLVLVPTTPLSPALGVRGSSGESACCEWRMQPVLSPALAELWSLTPS